MCKWTHFCMQSIWNPCCGCFNGLCEVLQVSGLYLNILLCLCDYVAAKATYTVSQKKEATKLLAVTLSNLNRFSKLFHWQTQQEICYAALCRHSTTPNVCRYTTVWNINYRKKSMKFTRVPKSQADTFVTKLWLIVILLTQHIANNSLKQRITIFCCQISWQMFQ